MCCCKLLSFSFSMTLHLSCHLEFCVLVFFWTITERKKAVVQNFAMLLLLAACRSRRIGYSKRSRKSIPTVKRTSKHTHETHYCRLLAAATDDEHQREKNLFSRHIDLRTISCIERKNWQKTKQKFDTKASSIARKKNKWKVQIHRQRWRRSSYTQTWLRAYLFIVQVKSTSSVQALISSCPGSCAEYSDPIRTILASKEAGNK